MLRVVIDTNVIVSALHFGGNPAAVLDLVRRGKVRLLLSPFILEEVSTVLGRKFRWETRRIQEVLSQLKRHAEIIIPRERLAVIRDKDDDNRILECAVEGKAAYLVSGDKRHLLPLRQYRHVRILSPAEFLEL
jgi:putative PIN family toxin of toxin-antitoxin system